MGGGTLQGTGLVKAFLNPFFINERDNSCVFFADLLCEIEGQDSLCFWGEKGFLVREKDGQAIYQFFRSSQKEHPKKKRKNQHKIYPKQ